MADDASVVIRVVKSERNPFPGLISLGRNEDCDLCLVSGQVSKLHCWFKRAVDGRWFVQDNRSANGTWVNTVRLAPDATHPLAPGDQVRFGGVNALFLDRTSLASVCSLVRTRSTS